MGLEGTHINGEKLQHWAADWVVESDGGHTNGTCLAPQQFPDTDDFTAHGWLNQELTWDAVQGVSMPGSSWCWHCGIELYARAID